MKEKINMAEAIKKCYKEMYNNKEFDKALETYSGKYSKMGIPKESKRELEKIKYDKDLGKFINENDIPIIPLMMEIKSIHTYQNLVAHLLAYKVEPKEKGE